MFWDHVPSKPLENVKEAILVKSVLNIEIEDIALMEIIANTDTQPDVNANMCPTIIIHCRANIGFLHEHQVLPGEDPHYLPHHQLSILPQRRAPHRLVTLEKGEHGVTEKEADNHIV